jgi:Zn-finger nucleic acid-binding protein
VCRVDVVLTDRQGIEIDYCPRCRGVWVDRGELDKIDERTAAHETAGAAPAPRAAGYPPADCWGGHGGGHGRGHGSKHAEYRRGEILGGLFGH